MQTYKAYTALILSLGLLIFAPPSISRIYRPSDAQALTLAVIDANSSGQDDIIDLQGGIFEFVNDCDTTDDNDGTNASCSQVNALPVIADAEGAGKLSIINGVIERDLSTPVSIRRASDDFRLIEIASGGDLTLYNITLRNGNAFDLASQVPPPLANLADGGPRILEITSDDGGAIYNAGTLDIQNSTLSNNVADESGGAIYNADGATLSIQSSNINNNLARNNDDSENNEGGGGIFNASGGTITTISNTTIADNDSKGNGGGLNNHGATRHIFNSTFSSNFCCSVDVIGGICPDPSAGEGGGIYNALGSDVLQIVNSTIANNAALNGGGIANLANAQQGISDNIPNPSSGLHVHNSTISGNTASVEGGGIFNSDNGPATIDNLVSSIVAGNSDNDDENSPDVYDGTQDNILNESHNLIGNNSGSTGTFSNGINNDIVGDSVSPINPLLGPLGFNEGFTSTMALLPGSPAINHGLNPHALHYDQRRSPFARVKCSRPDIGAYELQRCF